MVQIDSSTVDIGIDECDERFHQIEGIVYDRDEFKNARDRMFAQCGTLQLMALDVMMQKSGCAIMALDKRAIISYLQKYEGCPNRYFFTKNVQSASLDIAKVVQPLMANGYAIEFLDYYCMSRGLESKVNSMNTIVNQCVKEVGVDHNGKQLYWIPCQANQQVNLRYNYQKMDIISQIPKNVTHCISVEDGYVMAWGDFAQSDFRIAYNLFMRSPENDAVMAKCEDKYEGLARIVSKTTGLAFDEEQFKHDRALYKQLTLATVYGKRSSQSKVEEAFITKFAKFLEMCPRYVEFYNNAKDAYSLGLPIPVTSYFGYEQTCPILYDSSSTLFKTLNTPIQTGTSEIVIFSINYVLDTLYSMGYTEDDIKLYYTRHDEIIFKMRPCVMKDAWVFKQLKEICVDDWMPLSLTFNFGYNYGIEDQDLMEQYAAIPEHDVDRKKANVHRNYSPVAPILVMQVAYQYVADNTVIVFYNETDNSVSTVVARTNQADEVASAIQQALSRFNPGERYRGVLVKNSLFDNDDFNECSSYVKYHKVDPSMLVKVQALTAYTTCIYCKSIGVSSPVTPPTKNFEEFIHSVKKFTGIG